MARKTTEFLVVHCADTYARMDTSAAEFDKWHRTRGFLKIGYQFVIRRDGTIELGRGLYDAGAHAKGYNHKSVGICMVGGRGDNDGPENNFTPEQFAALKELLIELKTEFPTANIIGHNEISAKACPSFDVQEWITRAGLIAPAAGTMGDPNCPTCGQPI